VIGPSISVAGYSPSHERDTGSRNQRPGPQSQARSLRAAPGGYTADTRIHRFSLFMAAECGFVKNLAPRSEWHALSTRGSAHSCKARRPQPRDGLTTSRDKRDRPSV